MSNSNEDLIIKIRGISNRISQIQDEAGSMLVRNIRSQARQKFNNDPKYPYEFHNSFQRDDVVYHKLEEKAVYVDHPAAKRLEYGFGDITIRPKNAEKLHFKGQNGEDVYADEVHIKATKPVGYVRAAIKETQQDLQKRFKEVMS